MHKIFLFLVVILISGVFLTSCYDDTLSLGEDLGDLPAEVSVTVDFQPLIATENNTADTRSAGNAISTLDNIILFIYSANGDKQLADIKYSEKNELSNLRVIGKDMTGANTDSPYGNKAESTTARATFTITDVAPGYYYIYLVANVDASVISLDKDVAMRDFRFVEDLKSVCLQWNETNVGNNSQMFGYLTSGDYNNFEDGFAAPRVAIGKNSGDFHCWLKRAASKVTVVFDGSGLKDNIWIYVKSVTIKDIPRFCLLGNDNTVTDEKDLIESGETISYTGGHENWHDWLSISKGSGKKGAVTIENGVEKTHSEYADALYFFENKQGDYEGKFDFNKAQVWENVGWIPEKGQYDYKDNVPYGTYIEVEAYYVSDNPERISNGEIKYRFMLGQNVTYNYDAIRSHHYKVTLGFKGFANQPDWHIVYRETGDVFVPGNNYYMSYQYNRRSEFPIRINGNVTEMVVEIVENNWAPYEENGASKDYMNVPVAAIPGTGTEDFKWNRLVYENSNAGFYYGLQKPWNSDGTAQISYSAKQIAAGAPEKVTPIWAGFLALQVPGDTRTDLANYLFPVGGSYSYSYSNVSHIEYFKKYFYGKGGNGEYINYIPQNIRKFSKADLTFEGWQEGNVMKKTIGSGNNACEITKNSDGSLTVNLPMWTRPKTMMGISGFSGNNPYDAYRRRAKVMITATFGEGSESSTTTIVKPVFQVRRVVNPKGIWHTYDNTEPFTVRLCMREGMNAKVFTPLTSDGMWRAYVKETSAGDAGFISLSGGIGRDPDKGGIIGSTDSEIEFTINFSSQGNAARSRCAIVEVEYHGYTCTHTIFVRQGYREPLAVVNNGAKWSSFSLYGCSIGGTDINSGYATSWNGSNYIDAELTASPLALGSLFKRGNYNGIRIENNTVKPANVAPGKSGTFKMTNGMLARWGDIKGLAYSASYSGLSKWTSNDVHNTFRWRHFRAKVKLDGTASQTRYYRVASKNDFDALLSPEVDYSVGVLYADGTLNTQMDVDKAYGFEDFDNDGDDFNESGGSHRGMRGIIIFNSQNAHQLFFPIGARGMGRRTITGFTATSYDNFGTLRYGAVTSVLDQNHNINNQYRPIPYNMPAAPGAIYWLENIVDSYPGWDMNYFDQNFNAYDYAVSFSYTFNSSWGITEGNGGDALPIKLVLDE